MFFIVYNSQENWLLFLVYLGVALPDLAYRNTHFLPSVEGKTNLFVLWTHFKGGILTASLESFKIDLLMLDYALTITRFCKIKCLPYPILST